MTKITFDDLLIKDGKLRMLPRPYSAMVQLWNAIEEQQSQLEQLAKENASLRDKTTSSILPSRGDGHIIFKDFALTKDEYDQVRIWQINHINQYHKDSNAGAIGGRWDYVFTPTSIGTAGSCICNACAGTDADCPHEFVFRDLK